MLQCMFTVVLSYILYSETTTAANPRCKCETFTKRSKQSSKPIFKSPQFPVFFGADINCLLYTFHGSLDEIVNITFHEIDLPQPDRTTGRCIDQQGYGAFIRVYQDLVSEKVNETTTFQQELCGNHTNRVFYSKGYALILEFHSSLRHDRNYYHVGFTGDYEFLRKSKFQILSSNYISNCQHLILSQGDENQEPAYIYSPNFPYPYDNKTNFTCTYSIRAKPHEQAFVAIDELKLGVDTGLCLHAKERLTLYEGQTDVKRDISKSYRQSVELATYCYTFGQDPSNRRSPTVIKASGSMYIVFRGEANPKLENRRYKLRYWFRDKSPTTNPRIFSVVSLGTPNPMIGDGPAYLPCLCQRNLGRTNSNGNTFASTPCKTPTVRKLN